MSAAGSILRAHAGRGRRAALLVNGLAPRYQPVHTLDGDWDLALELLASAEPDGRNGVAALLVDGAGAPSKALELCVVTSGLSPRLTDRLLQRSVTRRGTSRRVRRPDELRAAPERGAAGRRDARSWRASITLASPSACCAGGTISHARLGSAADSGSDRSWLGRRS